MSLLPEHSLQQQQQQQHQTEEDPICRVCRSEATQLQPLFHPCKCSGSIKYVHQDCLTEWLTHSKKKYCELCNHPFSFTPIYDPTMPASMPLLIFAKRVIRRCLLKTQFWLRVALVGSVWIVILPFITVWVWRFYFWTGRTLAYSITGRLKESDSLAEEPLQLVDAWSSNETYPANSTLWSTNTTTFENYTEWTVHGIPVFTAASLFFSDCLEGQIITFAVVIGFVSAFLLREWIVRNTNQEALDDLLIDILPLPHPPIPEEERRAALNVMAVRAAQERRTGLDATFAPPLLEPEVLEPVAGPSTAAEMPESRKKGKERATEDDAGPSNSDHPVGGRSAIKRRFSTSDETQFSTRIRRRHADIPWEDRVAELWSEKVEYNGEYNAEEDELDVDGTDGDAAETEYRTRERKSSNDDNDNDDNGQARLVPPIFGRGIARPYRPSQSAPSATTENYLRQAPDDDRAKHGASFNENSVARASDENQPQGPDEAEEGAEPDPDVEDGQDNANMDVPPPPGNVAPDPAMVPIADDDDMNGDDLDGFMEAIGMRGSLWTLLQNAVLMTLLIAVVIWGGIFVPYLIGKTALLFKPLDILYLPLYVIYLPFDIIMFPLRILRAVTDPVLDLFLDYCSPYVWPFVSTHFNLISRSASALTETASTISAWMPESITSFIEPWKDWMWGPISAPVVTVAPVAVGGDSFVTSTLANGSRHLSEFALRWRDTGTPMDKFACIALGYSIVLLLGAFYLSSTRNEHGRTVGTALAQGFSTMLTGFKVLLFVIIELAIFPTGCGVLLDISMLPMFPGATVFTRWQFHQSAPFISTFLHWFIGTAFVYYFSVFVSICREIVRPGVLWWVKDPTDPDFQPIKEILERPARTQMKKIAVSAVIYSAIILIGMGSVLYFVKAVGRGVLPLRRGDNEPVYDFPADLVVANVLFPIFVRWANPKQIFRTVFTNWWRRMSRALRLTSFMFGDRYPDEEGSHVRRTAAAKLFFQTAPVMTLEEISAAREKRTREVNEIGGFAAMAMDIAAASEQETTANADLPSGRTDLKPAVYFVPDGGLVRAPAFDGIPVVPGKSMLIRVKEDGITVVSSSVSESAGNNTAVVTDVDGRIPWENLRNEVRPVGAVEEPAAGAIEGQRIGVHESGHQTNPNTTLVYMPPNFKHRVFLFLFLMWFHGSLLVTSMTILPLLVGRGFFNRALERDVHDVYSFIVGAILIVAFSTAAEAVLRFVKKILHTEWWQADWKQETKKIGQIMLSVLLNAYVIISIAGLVALELGIIHELYIFNPLRIATSSTAPLDVRTPQFYLQSWGVGIFLLKILYSGVFLARENYWSRTINEITAQGFMNLNVTVATRKLIVPAAIATVLAVTGPYAFTWILTMAIDIGDRPSIDQMYHFSYPAVLCCVVAYLFQRETVHQLEQWMQSVKDEEYLIGRQLNSLSLNGEPAPPGPQVGEEGVAMA